MESIYNYNTGGVRQALDWVTFDVAKTWSGKVIYLVDLRDSGLHGEVILLQLMHPVALLEHSDKYANCKFARVRLP